MLKHLLLALASLSVLCLALPAAAAGPDDPPPVFDTRPYDKARAAAQEAKKWFIVKATAVWCGPCKQMDATTWRDEKVVQWLKASAIVVALDVDKEPKLAKDLQVSAMPTMIAFKEGQEFDRVVGYQSPEDMLVWLQGIARGEKSIEAVQKRAGARGENGVEVDVRARLALARKLAQSGKPAEAADEFAWLWRHMLEHNQSYSGVRLSFMAGDMQRLAERDAGAKKKFTQLRDETLKALDGDKVDVNDVVDWVALNKIVSDGKATLAWYDRVKDQPRWARMIDRVFRDFTELFIAEKRWADIGHCIKDPVGDLRREHQILAMSRHQELFEDMPKKMLRDKARVLYAGLLAACKEDTAQALAAKAREFDPSADMVESLVETALEAGQPRPQQLDWLQKVGPENHKELIEKVRSALATTTQK